MLPPPWLSFLFSLAVAAALLAAARPGVPQESSPGRRNRLPVAGVVLLGSVLLGLGGVDRLFPGVDSLLLGALLLGAAAWTLALVSEVGFIPWWVRDAGLVAVGVAAYRHGVTIELFKLPFTTHYYSLGPAAALVTTVVWILLVTHAFLTTRSVPGLTTSTGGVTALTLGIVALLQPQDGSGMAAVLAFGLAGACAGLHLAGRGLAPQVGAAGSTLLGFLLAVVTIVAALKNTAFLIMVLPLLVLGAPLLNVTCARAIPASEVDRGLAIIRRRVCLHEMLLRQHVPPAKVVAWFTAIDGYLCLVALLLVRLIEVHWLIKILLLVVLLPAGYLFFLSVAKILGREDERPVPPEVRLLGVRLTPVSMEQAVQRIEAFIRSRQPHHIVTSDSSAILKAQTDHELHEILDHAHLVTPDGIGVIWSARLLDIPVFERVSGVDLVARLAQRGAEVGYRFFLLGAAPGIAEAAAEKLSRRYPGLQVVGAHHGYFSPEEEPALIRRIRDARPDVLLVAFGIPKQEKWIRSHLEDLRVPVCIGVGGTFDVYSGRLKRAPEWVQRCGLEWLYRGLIEPKRLLRLAAIPRFIWLTLRHRLMRFHQGRQRVS